MANSGNPRHQSFSSRLPYLLFLGVAGKLLIDSTVQIYNPFLSIIAVGVGLSTVTMGRLIALRSVMGFAGPFLGSLADRIGHKPVIRTGLLLVGAGMILAAASKNVYVFGLAVVATGIGHIAFTPNLHAYLSAQLPYRRRAMGLGIIEYSWALAGIIGLSISGYLIEAFSWRAPFYLLGGALITMTLIYGTLPGDTIKRPNPQDDAQDDAPDDHRTVHQAKPDTLPTFAKVRAFLDLGPNSLSAWSCIAVAGLSMFSMMHLMIIHGGWLQAEYDLTSSDLGKVALLFGLCDLSASVLVSTTVDRIGKRRSVLIGASGMAVGYALLPLLNQSPALAIAGIAIPRAFFEFTIVSNFPLLSEQVPESRGRVMGLGMTAGLIGTTVAGLTSPTMYLRFGVWGLGPVSLAATVIALFFLVFAVREGREPPAHDRSD